VVVHSYNPSTWKAEARRIGFEASLGLQTETSQIATMTARKKNTLQKIPPTKINPTFCCKG
jgi:hypothetical protein